MRTFSTYHKLSILLLRLLLAAVADVEVQVALLAAVLPVVELERQQLPPHLVNHRFFVGIWVRSPSVLLTLLVSLSLPLKPGFYHYELFYDYKLANSNRTAFK